MNPGKHLHFNIGLLKFGALYNVTLVKNVPLKCFLYLSRILCSLSNVYMIHGAYLHVKGKGFDEFDSCVMSYLHLIIAVCVLVRINYYYVYNHLPEDFVRKLRGFFIYKTRTGLEEKSMDHYVKVSYNYSRIYICNAMMFGLIGHFIPSLLAKKERTLPMSLVYPYNWKESPFYEISFFMQFLMQLIIVMVFSSTDTLFGSLIYLTTGQFELLGWEFKSCVYSVLLSSGFDKETVIKFRRHLDGPLNSKLPSKDDNIARDVPDPFFKINQTITSKKFTTALIKKFGELIEFHQSLVRFCSELEKFFSPLLLVYNIFVIFLNLICAFFIITTDDTILEICGFVYFISSSFSIFCPCLLGELLKTRSEELQYILYTIEWYMCGKKFEKLLMMMHFRLAKPVTLTVGKFADLNLETFMWTMKTSFSYFTVLRQFTQFQNVPH